MKLSDYLEKQKNNIISSIFEAKSASKEAPKDADKKLLNNRKAKEVLEKILNITVSGKLGIPLSVERKQFLESHESIKKIIFVGIGKNITDESVPRIFRSGGSEVFKVQLKNGDFFFFKKTSGGDIGEKELAPAFLLDLSTNKRYSKSELVKLVKAKISTKAHFNPKIKELIYDFLSRAEKNNNLPREGNAKKILLKEENFLQRLKEFDESDTNKIWKDLGEVLSAIIACEGRKNAKIYFPPNVAQPLVDFFIELGPNDVESYSSKAIKKASSGSGKPAITGLIPYMNKYKLVLKNDPKEKILYEIMQELDSVTGMAESYFTLLKYLDKIHPGITERTKKLFKNRFKKDYNEVKADEKDKISFAYLAYLTCRDLLNKEYADTLTQIVNAKVNVNQAYLVSPRPNGLLFYFKNFKDLRFVFQSGVGPTDINAKMGFVAKISEKDLK